MLSCQCFITSLKRFSRWTLIFITIVSNWSSVSVNRLHTIRASRFLLSGDIEFTVCLTWLGSNVKR
jgi:hypothetical protein